MTDPDRAASVPAGSPVELDATTGLGRRGVFAVPLLARDGVRITVLWVVLGSILGEFALHVGDYIDFDAGRYERLAISIARTHSVVPRVNGVDIHSFSQLYPLLIAPFFAHGLIVDRPEERQPLRARTSCPRPASRRSCSPGA